MLWADTRLIQERVKDTFLVDGEEIELVVKDYYNVSFQSDKVDFRSQSSYVFYLNGAMVSWKHSKQETVTNSTMEAEYIITYKVGKEAF